MNTIDPVRSRQYLAGITLLVDNYDSAINYYTRVIGFELIEDSRVSPTKRWVLIAPPGSSQTRLVLAEATNEAQTARIGDQAGGRVFLFVHTDDFRGDHARLCALGVEFVDGPRQESFGTIGIFRDRYGHRWELIERRGPPGGG